MGRFHNSGICQLLGLEESKKIRLLFAHLDRSLKIWVELYFMHYYSHETLFISVLFTENTIHSNNTTTKKHRHYNLYQRQFLPIL